MDANSDGLTDGSTKRYNISREFIPLIVGGICPSNVLPDKLISLTLSWLPLNGRPPLK